MDLLRNLPESSSGSQASCVCSAHPQGPHLMRPASHPVGPEEINAVRAPREKSLGRARGHPRLIITDRSSFVRSVRAGSLVNALLLVLHKTRRSRGNASHCQRVPCPPGAALTFPGVLWLRQKHRATVRMDRPAPQGGHAGARARGCHPAQTRGEAWRPCRRLGTGFHPRPRGGALGEEGLGVLRSPALRRPVQGPGCP